MIKAPLQRSVVLLAGHRPAILYGGLGQLARLTRRRSTTERLRAVFAHLTAGQARRAASELHGAELKTRALGIVLARTPGEPVFPAVRVDAAFAAVRGPAILATPHVGAIAALGAALQRMPGEVVALHRMQWRLPGNVTGVYVPATEVGSAAALHRAVVAVRRGACVLVLVDGSGHEVTVLGRRTSLKRGAFALARLTGVPVTPVFARWDGAAVEVVCAEPIAAREDEAAMAAAMADAIDRRLREHPAAIGDHLLRHLTRPGAATSP